MSSLLPSYVFLLIPIESAFLAFHISVFFLTAQKLRKNRQFSHAFYTLFLLQCCSNYANYGLMWLDRCIYEYKLLPVAQGALDIGYYFMLAYAMYFQAFTQVAIACNRLTAISFPFQHGTLWRGKTFSACLALVFGLPFLCASSRPLLALAVGGLWWSAWGWAEHYRIVLTVVIFAAVCLTNGLMELWTFYKYHRLNATRCRENREEYRLLVYAMLELITLLLRTAYFFLLATTDGGNWRVLQVAVYAMRCVISVETFSSPVLLLLTSITVRLGYLEFYGWKRRQSATATVHFSYTMSGLSKA